MKERRGHSCERVGGEWEAMLCGSRYGTWQPLVLVCSSLVRSEPRLEVVQIRVDPLGHLLHCLGKGKGFSLPCCSVAATPTSCSMQLKHIILPGPALLKIVHVASKWRCKLDVLLVL